MLSYLCIHTHTTSAFVRTLPECWSASVSNSQSTAEWHKFYEYFKLYAQDTRVSIENSIQCCCCLYALLKYVCIAAVCCAYRLHSFLVPTLNGCRLLYVYRQILDSVHCFHDFSSLLIIIFIILWWIALPSEKRTILFPFWILYKRFYFLSQKWEFWFVT